MRIFSLNHRLGQLLSLSAVLLALTPAAQTQAQSQTQTQINKPIRLIVPYAPGGATDALARLVAPYVGEEFGQQVVIENRPGGGSTIGTLAVAKAEPDGLTIGMIDAAFITNPSLVAKLPYDTLKDFAPIVFIATSPLVLVVNPAFPALSVNEFIAYAKANPDKVTFGSAGQGTGVHLAAEQFRAQAGVPMLHVPFKGTGEAVTQLVGGQITAIFSTQTGAKSMIDAVRLRALAITSQKRSDLLPNVPTFAESGYKDVDASTINGLIAPKGTPDAFIQRVNAAINRALKNPALIARLDQQGFVITGGTPAQFAEWIPKEIGKWEKIIKDANIKAQ